VFGASTVHAAEDQRFRPHF